MIPENIPINTYNGDNSTILFKFNFLINKEEEILVTYVDKNDNKILLGLNKDYSVKEIGKIDGSYVKFPLEGSTYTTLKEDEKIILELNLPIVQNKLFSQEIPFDLSSLEYSLDYLTRLIQILQSKIDSYTVNNSEVLNNPYSLFESKYSEFALNNSSWLLSMGQYNSSGIYPTAYNALEIEYDPEKIIGENYNLDNGSSYIKRGLPVSTITPVSRTESGTSGWSNVANAFDGNLDTYASCGTATDYISVVYNQDVTITGFIMTGRYIGSVARACNMAIYAVVNGEELLLANGTGAQYNVTYFTTKASFTPKTAREFRFKLINSTENTPPTTQFPTRVVNISLIREEENDLPYNFIINQEDKTFRLPLLNGSENLPGNTYTQITFPNSDKPLERNNFTYKLPQNGFLSVTASAPNNNNWSSVYLRNNQAYITAQCSENVQGSGINCNVSGTKNQQIYSDHANMGALSYKFSPMVGNGSLYYYVGDVIKDISIIQVGKILEELAKKVEIAGAAEASKPGYWAIDLTLGASGSVYIAPESGWFCMSKSATAIHQYIAMSSYNLIGLDKKANAVGEIQGLFFPCMKGQPVLVEYNMAGETRWFRFVYDKGTEHLRSPNAIHSTYWPEPKPQIPVQ